MANAAGIRQQKMNIGSDAQTVGRELQAFSRTFYERPGIATALIALQDETGRDVNLILFAIWLGLSGRGRLTEQKLAAAEHAVYSIRVEVIEPLRALRRHLSTIVDADIQRVRERIKVVEIEAEEAAQFRLAGIAGTLFNADPVQRLADAEANLDLHLSTVNAGATHAAIIRRELQRLFEAAGPGG
jgi:uncharacterized protein (TIGR02444 family)